VRESQTNTERKRRTDSIAKWLGDLLGNQRKVPGSIYRVAYLVLWLFLTYSNSGVMPTGKIAHPAVTSMGTWCSKCPAVLVVPSGVGVGVEFWDL